MLVDFLPHKGSLESRHHPFSSFSEWCGPILSEQVPDAARPWKHCPVLHTIPFLQRHAKGILLMLFTYLYSICFEEDETISMIFSVMGWGCKKKNPENKKPGSLWYLGFMCGVSTDLPGFRDCKFTITRTYLLLNRPLGKNQSPFKNQSPLTASVFVRIRTSLHWVL